MSTVHANIASALATAKQSCMVFIVSSPPSTRLPRSWAIY
jgi:hypothetical protein